MKIIFMGTPDFSVPTLEALIHSEHEIVACYTQPDKAKGRGNKMQMTPVKEVCLAYHIPVYQPLRIRNKEEVETFLAIEADVAVVIAYGQILPKAILDSPRYGCINIHASLLPKYRGAAPYQWAVIKGEIETGITTMQMDVGMDTGDMLMKTVVAIEEKETAGSLHDKLMQMGAPLILETLEGIEKGSLQAIKQEADEATYAPMLDKDYGHIDWEKDAKTIELLVRGLNPWPSAFSFINDRMIKIWDVSVVEDPLLLNKKVRPGSIIQILPKEGFLVMCKNNALLIKEIQLQGKKRMDSPSFLRGFNLEIGTLLE
jgi:methionyl-tRNA formyltransferase